jgi:shikimate dehydrogenase
MKGQPGLEIDLGSAGTGTIVTDIVYTPLETPLLAQARERGLAAVDGLGMLLHQAVPGFEKWFGQRPEVDETLRQLLLGELARREAAS